MKISKIFLFILIFLVSGMPAPYEFSGDARRSVPGFGDISSAGAEEVIQLARLSPRRRRPSATRRLRTRVKVSRNRSFGRKVFSSPRGLRTRRGRNLVFRRFIPRRVIALGPKRFISPTGGAISASRAVARELRSRQGAIRGQFSTALRRRD